MTTGNAISFLSGSVRGFDMILLIVRFLKKVIGYTENVCKDAELLFFSGNKSLLNKNNYDQRVRSISGIINCCCNRLYLRHDPVLPSHYAYE